MPVAGEGRSYFGNVAREPHQRGILGRQGKRLIGWLLKFKSQGTMTRYSYVESNYLIRSTISAAVDNTWRKRQGGVRLGPRIVAATAEL